jgi:hypothetical protein
MNQKLRDRIEKIIDENGGGLWKETFTPALIALNSNHIYDEISNHGVKYPAVRAFRQLDGHGFTTGIGYWIVSYCRLVDPTDWYLEWLGFTQQISFVNGKLVLLGRHGQLREITHEWLVDEFIRIHLKPQQNNGYLPKLQSNE